MIRLTLYTTLGCHLCSLLEANLERLANAEVALERIDIATSASLLARYAERIPVLMDEAGATLERGFEAPRLAAWLAERNWLDQSVWALERGAKRAPNAPTVHRGRRYLKAP